ncbi:MAG TPA: DUF1579 family protein [Bryobacteraceae bacterium]|nr:DUF1579 family protein [Bryobacteraceae bacterium]
MKAALLTLLATAALAQNVTPPAGQLAEMKKLDFLLGEWRGGGWIQMGPEKQEFEGRESVASKLGGLILTIEGVHHRKAGSGTPVHNAFAVVSYDPRARMYQFRAYTANGQALTADGRIRDGGFEWGFEVPGGSGMKIRYFIRLDDKGKWVETGEMSRDGSEWRQFFEMRLTRQPSRAAVPVPPPAFRGVTSSGTAPGTSRSPA